MRKKDKLEKLLPSGVTGPFTRAYYESESFVKSDPKKACDLFLQLVLRPILPEDPATSVPEETVGVVEDPLRIKEAAVSTLCKIQIENNFITEAKQTFTAIRPFFGEIPKARAAKIIRNYIESLSFLPNATDLQMELCLQTIEWSQKEKRTFLKHRIEARLALLYYDMKRYSQSLFIVQELLKEVKRLDDKFLSIEVYYIESKVYFSLKNLPKAKAAMTAARNNANAIHCPPLLQADLDILAGALHLEESDPKTAYSYFVEAFETYNLGRQEQKALCALKYAMLTKILSNQSQDISGIVAQRQYLSYRGKDTDAFVQVAKSYGAKNVKMFEQCLKDYEKELKDDPIISRHTNKLYQTLLEQNMLRVLKPYSRVELTFLAGKLQLPLQDVQEKLSQMILDKIFSGMLDQGSGVLQIFEEETVSSTYEDSGAIFENLTPVIDILHSKASAIL